MRITLAVWPFRRACGSYHLHRRRWRRTINTAPHHTSHTAAPPNPPYHKPGPLHRHTVVESVSPPRHLPPIVRCYETRPAAAADGGLGDASVTPVGRRPKTWSVMVGGRGALGIRRLDVIDPNRPRGTPLTTAPSTDSGVRACVHVWQPLIPPVPTRPS